MKINQLLKIHLDELFYSMLTFDGKVASYHHYRNEENLGETHCRPEWGQWKNDQNDWVPLEFERVSRQDGVDLKVLDRLYHAEVYSVG
jgi:hypothetical protein